MYIHPFICGVVFTVFAEIAALVIYSIAKKKR